ncbi:MAG: hypothetical protein Q9182_005840 [Xanthomendoza sp. 2 TL-2023]
MAPIVQYADAASLSKTSGVKKRGWPKGKPRKGHVKLSKAGKAHRLKKNTFPFLDLPLDLRRYFYELVLPQQDVTMSSSRWASIHCRGRPNQFMNLLLANKKVCDEGRSVLYGANRFTIIISGSNTHFLRSSESVDFQTFPKSPSPLPHIKNWQLALWPFFNARYGEDIRFHDAVLSVCAAIAKTPNLQNLKLTIPCLCEYFEEIDACPCSEPDIQCRCVDIEDIHSKLTRNLAPLNLLRFNGEAQIVATPKPVLKEDYRFPDHDWEDGYIELSAYPHLQCQKPVCLSFAASFGPFMATLTGKTTRISLTENQIEWLELKSRIQQVPERLLNKDLEDAVSNTWEALESGSDQYFQMEKAGAEAILQLLQQLRH